jgi:hypothetical protein
MNPPENLGIFLHSRKRERGRRPQAAPAWERMGCNINFPVAHPQQEPAELAGNAGGGENLIAEIQGGFLLITVLVPNSIEKNV